MEELRKYPINIDSHEQGIIINLIKDRKNRIPHVWQQLLDKKDPVMINAFEQGFLMGIMTDQREKIPGAWRQLVDLVNKFREDAGVKITELGNGLIQLKDDFGNTIVREKYEWEI
jgi:hypothetical protein